MQHSIRQDALQKIFSVYRDWVEESAFACARGCSACCTENVMVSALEGEQVLAEVRKKALEEWFAKRLERPQTAECRLTMNEWAAHCIDGKDPAQNLGEEDPAPCPFLADDNSCPVYEARPFACRCFVSLTPCLDGDAASQPQELIAVNTAVMQIIEHLSQGGLYGPLSRIVSSLCGKKEHLDIAQFFTSHPHQGNSGKDGLRRSRPLPGFVTGPKEQEIVQSFLSVLFQERISNRSLKDILNNG